MLIPIAGLAPAVTLKKAARMETDPILAFFSAVLCGPCRQAEEPVMSTKRVQSLLLIFWIGWFWMIPSLAAVNSVYISSRLDPNSIIITAVDIVFVYDSETVNRLPGTKSQWYAGKREFTDTAGDSIDIVHIFIPQGFDSVMASLPERSLEALKVVIFAEHDDSKAQPQDITDLGDVLIEIDQFGIRISRRE